MATQSSAHCLKIFARNLRKSWVLCVIFLQSWKTFHEANLVCTFFHTSQLGFECLHMWEWASKCEKSLANIFPKNQLYLKTWMKIIIKFTQIYAEAGLQSNVNTWSGQLHAQVPNHPTISPHHSPPFLRDACQSIHCQTSSYLHIVEIKSFGFLWLGPCSSVNIKWRCFREVFYHYSQVVKLSQMGGAYYYSIHSRQSDMQVLRGRLLEYSEINYPYSVS